MKNITSVDELEPDEIDIRCKALRDAIICMGWGRVISVAVCLALYVLVHGQSKGHMSDVLQVMLLVITLPHVVEAILMFMGAMEANIFVIDLLLWICLLIGCFDAILGVMGAIYFIRYGHSVIHYLLAAVFAGKALCFYEGFNHYESSTTRTFVTKVRDLRYDNDD